MASLDHLMFACADVDKAADWIEKTFGVRPVNGGKHVGRGTRNALVALGGNIYLELIGPDMEQEKPSQVDARGQPYTPGRLVHWCAKSPNLKEHQAFSKGMKDWPLGDVFAMKRETPEGALLEWSLSVPSNLPMGGCLPFLIDWEKVIPNGLHPATTSPKGLELMELRLEHPDDAEVNKALSGIGVLGGDSKVKVVKGNSPGIAAVIKGPKGTFTLTEVGAGGTSKL